MVRLFAPSCNELRATDTARSIHMNILSVQSPEPTFFMYSILDYLLKFSTTNKELPHNIIESTHEHTIVLRTTPNVLLQCVQSSGLAGCTYIHTYLTIKPMHI